MTSFDRRQKILELVRTNESNAVQSLLDTLGTSSATLRRDLAALEEAGKVIRTHGGVLHPRRLSAEPSFSIKQKQAPAQKRCIGRCAGQSIPAKATVFIDAGTTCLEAGLILLERNENTLFTNSLPLLYHGCSQPGRVIALGGEVRSISRALVGSMALKWLQNLRFDFAIIGASALDADAGAFTTEIHEAEVKSQALKRSGTALLLADSDKLNTSTPVNFAAWTAFDRWVTDEKVPPTLKRKLKNHVNLSIALPT